MYNLERYVRQITLPEVGVKGQQRLKASRVAIVGTGGLGSPAAIYLANAGVGTIGLVDDDIVSLSNLHRQILHRYASVGKDKVDSAKETLSGLNPDIKINIYKERISEKNAVKILSDYDIVLDGLDNFPTRYVVNEACVRAKIPLVHGSILRFQGQVSVFNPKNGGPCYACLYPEPPPPEVAPSGTEAGILGMIPGIIGTIEALQTIKFLLGFGEPLIGKLLIFDGLACKMKTLEINKDPKCRVCGL